MKQKIIIVFVVMFSCTSAAQLFSISHSVDLTPSESVPSDNEITIRNVTNEIVYYTIKPSNSDNIPSKKTLKQGGVHHFQGNMGMEIAFQRDGKTIKYQLFPGMPYSFIYNEKNELDLHEDSPEYEETEDLAPFVPTPMDIVEKMLELAKVKKTDVLFDLGCGDGRIVITAAKKYGARGVGIDFDPERIKESIVRAKKARVEKLVEFRLQDVMKADFSKATIVTLYLLTESNRILRPLLEKQLKPGTIVVSHDYEIPGWEKKQIDYMSLLSEEGEEHLIYVYKR